MANPAKYLLPTEKPVINIRRHWAVVAGVTLQSLLLLIIGILAVRLLTDFDFGQMVAVWFCIFVVVRWMWALGDWYVEKLVVTDKRVLLVTGIVTRKVAIMPLVKVTDLTFNRSATGLMLGYGQFVVETAGQDQALSRIDFVPKPEMLYMQISELLFGGDKGAPGALVTAAQLEGEEEADRLARRRWRRFSRRRRVDAEDRAPAAAATPTPSQLDAILADRDTLLLAVRDDSVWDRDARDRAERDYGFDDRGFDDRDLDDDPYRQTDPGAGLPRFHEPRRGGDSGFGPVEPRLPPLRRRDHPPAGTDPADD